MTKQEYDNAIKKLDAEIWTAFSSEQVNEIAEKKDEINSQYIASLESQNATLTDDNASLIQQMNEAGAKYEKLVEVIDMALSDVDDGGYVRAGARLRKWKMEKGGQDV